MAKLEGQVAIVTGSSRGIGRGIAVGLAREGATVVLSARGREALDLVAQEFSSRNWKSLAVPADVSREEDVHRLVSRTVETFGRIDILVNNAGTGVFKKVVDLGAAELDQMWNVNVRGVFLMTRAVLPDMIRRHQGDIVNIASLAGKNWIVGGAGYAATKWALRGFAGSLMLEVREHNIRVTSVFPGSVDTDFSSPSRRGNRITQPEDVAEAVLFAVTAPRRAMFSEIDVRPTNPK